MDNRQFDYYQKLKLKVKRYSESEEARENPWFEFISYTPELFYVLCKLAVETKIDVKKRIKLASAIAYFMSPFDFLPEEIIGPAGYLDDVTVAAVVLKKLASVVEPEIIEEHWRGTKKLSVVIDLILENAEEMLGKELWEKIKEKFS